MTQRLNFLRRGALWTSAIPAVFVAGPVAAATQDGDAEVRVFEQLSLTQISALDFGTIIPSNTAGRIIVRRNNNNCVARGGATLVGTDCQRGEFLVTGEARQRFRITLASAPITLTQQSGSATMVMDRVRINGNRNKRLNAAGQRTFYVSGRLQVGANQDPGVYDGTFNVTVEYR